VTTVTEEQHGRILRQMASGREAVARAHREQERIDEALERSRRTSDRALPVLRRAGYLR